MNESFVDLTYRGLSLGRRIKLTQVRPSSGYVELPTPMPVGTHIAIATDDGVGFSATVDWIREQVAGSDQPPGMVVIPDLAAESAAAWWKARVALPDDDAPRPRQLRNRPVTVRPRSHTRPTKPPPGATADADPMAAADLSARVAAAAGVEASVSAAPAIPATPVSVPPPPPLPTAPPVVPAIPGFEPSQVALLDDDDEPEVTLVSEDAAEPDPAIRTTGEHAVVDDGHATAIMHSVDPVALGLDASGFGEVTDPGVRDPDHRDASGHTSGGSAGDDPGDGHGGR